MHFLPEAYSCKCPKLNKKLQLLYASDNVERTLYLNHFQVCTTESISWP